MKSMLPKSGMAVRLKDERGLALILALVMLAVMSLLGVLALNTTDTELKLTTNLRASQQSFLAADRGVEYAMTNPTIYTTIGTGEIDLETATHVDNINRGTGYTLYQEAGDTDEGANDNKVRFIAATAPPVGTGTDPTKFEARYYFVSVTGEGPKSTRTRIESQISRIVPKPN